MIGSKFTFGQLALITWQLAERAQASREAGLVVGNDVDLRRLTGTELSRHLTRLGS